MGLCCMAQGTQIKAMLGNKLEGYVGREVGRMFM